MEKTLIIIIELSFSLFFTIKKNDIMKNIHISACDTSVFRKYAEKPTMRKEKAITRSLLSLKSILQSPCQAYNPIPAANILFKHTETYQRFNSQL